MPLSAKERDIVVEVLASERVRGTMWLFGYVVMPNHLHLLLPPRNVDLHDVMRAFKSIAAQRIMRARGKRGPLWQPRYFDNIVRHVRTFWEKLEYIHNNPVVANLAGHAEDWRWSSSAAYSRVGVALTPVDKPSNLPTNGDALLWPAF